MNESEIRTETEFNVGIVKIINDKMSIINNEFNKLKLNKFINSHGGSVKLPSDISIITIYK